MRAHSVVVTFHYCFLCWMFRECKLLSLSLNLLQGCWRAVGASFGKSITFKTTLKGSNMLMKNGLGDLWMPCVCFLGLLASLGFGLHKVNLLHICRVYYSYVLSDFQQLNINRPYRDAQNKPAWRDRTWATHT